ncbi:Fucose 4-O-acetylase [Haloechinothrix alba]|uniref:Fucose 4-O-acetylase n=1 Tax=Haloechinothrix alba TaxID=664784 RepID=A0A238XFC8_9PSEU|nr:acyltransferase family protein [Haloechinothrix alba]SNR57034.1 Fucose 4-O-acetylase [Haloechinothrix alba]
MAERSRTGAGIAVPERRNEQGEISRESRSRDSFVDNAKFLAIALVVIGHAVEPLTEGSSMATVLFISIYAFHMPAFVLMAGYLSRGFTATPRQSRRVITTIVVPYLVFEVTFELFKAYFLDGASNEINVADPSYAMWFLCTLFIWRLSAPLWRAMKPATAVVVAVAISVSSGVLALPETLDMYRTLGFLPFFVIGLVLPVERYVALLHTVAVRAAAVLAFAGAVAVAYLLLRSYSLDWLYFTYGYASLGVGDVKGMLARSVILVGAFGLLTAFFALVPRRSVWFTSLGAGSLYVYLLHRYVIKGPEYTGLYDRVEWLHTPSGVAVTVLLGLVLTVVLASGPVRSLFRPLVEPRLDWLFRRG